MRRELFELDGHSPASDQIATNANPTLIALSTLIAVECKLSRGWLPTVEAGREQVTHGLLRRVCLSKTDIGRTRHNLWETVPVLPERTIGDSADFSGDFDSSTLPVEPILRRMGPPVRPGC